MLTNSIFKRGITSCRISSATRVFTGRMKPALCFTRAKYMQCINASRLIPSKRYFSEYAKVDEETEFMDKNNMSQEKFEDIKVNEVKAFLFNIEQIYQSSPNHTPTLETLKEDLAGFEAKGKYTLDRIQQILVTAAWVSLKCEIRSLKGFNTFYRELKEVLTNGSINPLCLTSMFIFINNVFANAENSQILLNEKNEISAIAVNQLIKHFDSANLLDLSFALNMASQGKDQVFKYKFSKQIAAKVTKMDASKAQHMSIRCLLHIMGSFANSSYFGQECWQVITSLIEKHSKDERIPLRVDEIKIFLNIIVSKNILNQTNISLICADLITLMEGGRFSYSDMFDIIATFYSQKIEIPKVIDLMIDYYVQRGYLKKTHLFLNKNLKINK